MKLLIDIPEHIYEHAKETTEDSRDEFDAMRAIANGTPARCMDEAEKERLIKKNMLSIENRVRNVFNQGYEMGVKESRSEIPNTCGDAISREELVETLDTWDKFGYAPTNELVPLRGNVDKDKYVPYIHYDDVIECIKGMPSVTPQQRAGMWIEHFDEIGKWYECDQCHTDWGGSVNYCPNCGAKMEVEE